MTLYAVICTTKQNNPWIEIITEYKSVADLECSFQQEKGIRAVRVEKILNQYPVKSKLNKNHIATRGMG